MITCFKCLLPQKRQKKTGMIEETNVQVIGSKEHLLIAYEFSDCSSVFLVFHKEI